MMSDTGQPWPAYPDKERRLEHTKEALKHVMNSYLSFGMSRLRVTNFRHGLLSHAPCALRLEPEQSEPRSASLRSIQSFPNISRGLNLEFSFEDQ